MEYVIESTIVALKSCENFNSEKNLADQENFLTLFPWENSVFNQEQKQDIEDLLLKYHYIFARHHLDIGANEEFKVKLTPENDKPMYTQGPLIAFNYQDEVLVKLALLKFWGVITPLTHSE